MDTIRNRTSTVGNRTSRISSRHQRRMQIHGSIRGNFLFRHASLFCKVNDKGKRIWRMLLFDGSKCSNTHWNKKGKCAIDINYSAPRSRLWRLTATRKSICTMSHERCSLDWNMEMNRHQRTIRNLFPTRIRRFRTMVNGMCESADRSYLFRWPRRE